ncbi:MAG: hypothetical protein IPM57_11290 [Oligoflexia bacterium]|nr:hypothetical protein [Oligoflexia bacterium]
MNKGALLLSDIVAFIFVVLPVSGSWVISLGICYYLVTYIHLAILVIIFPLILTLVFILLNFILRICLPSLKPGVYEKDSKMTKIWFCHFLLGNSLQASGLQPIVYSFHIFKYLYWAAMGAKSGYGILCNHLTRIRDFQLLEIGSGTSLSADTHIACHTWVGDRLMLGKVVIGKNVFVGMDVTIGPRTTIEDEAWVGTGNKLFRDHIKAKEKLGNFAYVHGRPYK